MSSRTICIDEDTGHSNDDCYFRAYHLSTEGSTPKELIENAVIVEIDQDGGDHEGDSIFGYSNRVIRTCLQIIREELRKRRASRRALA